MRISSNPETRGVCFGNGVEGMLREEFGFETVPQEMGSTGVKSRGKRVVECTWRVVSKSRAGRLRLLGGNDKKSAVFFSDKEVRLEGPALF